MDAREIQGGVSPVPLTHGDAIEMRSAVRRPRDELVLADDVRGPLGHHRRVPEESVGAVDVCTR